MFIASGLLSVVNNGQVTCYPDNRTVLCSRQTVQSQGDNNFRLQTTDNVQWIYYASTSS